MVSLEDIKSALADGELRLFYQPKVSMLEGKVIGAEALVRWCRKDGTIVGPDDFIAVAEQGDFLHSITLELLSQAVDNIGLVRQSFPGLSVSMNVTPFDLESHRVSELIDGYLSRGELSSADLQVEITESAVMTQFDHVYEDIQRLNDMGIVVLMDDFGIGYSSLDRLSQLPFSALKLDKGVVSRMGTSRQNLNVVKSSISMARELRMTSVAEGVETEAIYNFLLASGCEQAQGFWISKPLPVSDYIAFLGESRTYQGSQIGRVHQATMNIVQFRKSLIDAAFCKNMAEDEVLKVVTDPEVRLLAEESRFGVWYFGIGQSLCGISEFDVLKDTYCEMHGAAKHFMQAVENDADKSTVDKELCVVDEKITHVLAGLNALERRLLLSSETDDKKFAVRSVR